MLRCNAAFAISFAFGYLWPVAAERQRPQFAPDEKCAGVFSVREGAIFRRTNVREKSAPLDKQKQISYFSGRNPAVPNAPADLSDREAARTQRPEQGDL